ncbi:MAG: tetratricopeptide repeat protein [Planctomycetota bacterium]|jgi:tetratricopeptide (TPR) repeat protein
MYNKFKITGMEILVCIITVLVFCGCEATHDYVDKIKDKAEKNQHAMKAMNLYEQARQSYLSGNMQQARQQINDSIACKGDVVDALILRVQIAIDMNQHNEVMKAIDEGEEVAPDDPRFPYYTGIYHERKGKSAEALICYKEASKRDPSAVQYKLAVAEMMIEEEMFSKAGRYLWQAVRDHPNAPGLLQTLGALKQIEGDDKMAAIYFSEALALAPTAKPLRENMAKSYIKLGNFYKALQYLEPLLKEPEMENRYDLQSLTIKCYLKCNRPIEARSLLRKLVFKPGHATYGQLRMLADASIMLSDWALLDAAATRMISINPRAEPGYLAKAIYLENNSEKQAAWDILEKFRDENEDSVSDMVLCYQKELMKTEK